ncbi:MAG: YdiU family protein [Alloalcanivorax xenomutans]|jgi:serine/tyrosine/threonine adenylyltransferase
MSSPYGFHFDNGYTRLPERLFARCEPTPVSAPLGILFNRPLAEQLGLDAPALDSPDGAALLAGNTLAEGSEPIAQAYAGHQFGYPNMLGDGRAILLGEQLTPDGQRRDIQLKGAGRTPFSRGGDGRAALGPMLREYLISEAMHALGIATTRSLAVVATGEPVYRETALPGAILTRVAASHLRVGTFQFAAGQRDPELLETLVDYTLQRHYPELRESDNKALALLDSVMERQLDLIVHWMRVGFIHGVMNTDNVTLSGETIDYGPCAFMDQYHPDTVFSSIDHQGRYAYGNQPAITQWNLTRFAETLLPLIDTDTDTAVQKATNVIRSFSGRYDAKWLAMMRAKLGLFGDDPVDATLIQDLLDWMQRHQADYTNTFRDLIGETAPVEGIYQDEAFENWHQRWQARLSRNAKPLKSSFCLMRNNNPAVIPRNHKVEEALNAAVRDDDLGPTHRLLDALSHPYQDRDDIDDYRQPPKPTERVLQTFCGT